MGDDDALRADAFPEHDASAGDAATCNPADCPLGCHPTEPRCNDIDPSNGLAPYLDMAANGQDVVLTDGAVINTTEGTIVDGDGTGLVLSTSMDDAGRPVGIFVVMVKSLDASGITVVGDRALAIVSAGNITLRGVLSVSADQDVSGPGALVNDPICRGENGEGVDGEENAGGGGGGFGTAGGHGGNAGGSNGGEGGQVAGDIELSPLRGGCPGGSGYFNDVTSSDFGAGGGGAIQLVAAGQVYLAPGSFIAANGGSAHACTPGFICTCAVGAVCFSGDGGGAGGGIIIEAMAVKLAAGSGLVANGGAGHCGPNGNAPAPSLSAEPAQGTVCGDESAGDGGAGTIEATAATSDFKELPEAGGGGGGAGRIRVNLPVGSSFEPAGVVSPIATVGPISTR